MPTAGACCFCATSCSTSSPQAVGSRGSGRGGAVGGSRGAVGRGRRGAGGGAGGGCAGAGRAAAAGLQGRRTGQGNSDATEAVSLNGKALLMLRVHSLAQADLPPKCRYRARPTPWAEAATRGAQSHLHGGGAAALAGLSLEELTLFGAAKARREVGGRVGEFPRRSEGVYMHHTSCMRMPAVAAVTHSISAKCDVMLTSGHRRGQRPRGRCRKRRGRCRRTGRGRWGGETRSGGGGRCGRGSAGGKAVGSGIG